jgi:hypothetical protein
MECNDEEFIKVRDGLLGLANKFHRVGEIGCKKLEPIVPENA